MRKELPVAVASSMISSEIPIVSGVYLLSFGRLEVSGICVTNE